MFNLKNYNLNDTVIEWVQAQVKGNGDFDESKFEEWLKEKNVAFKSNPSAWLKTVFPKELEKGTFNRVTYVPATVPLFNAMRDKGIIVKQTDCLYIDLLLTKISKALGKSKSKEQVADKIGEWCKGSIEYITTKIEKPTSSDFINVFKKSKAVAQLKIDWVALQQEADKENKEWDELMDFFRKGEEEYEKRAMKNDR